MNSQSVYMAEMSNCDCKSWKNYCGKWILEIYPNISKKIKSCKCLVQLCTPPLLFF